MPRLRSSFHTCAHASYLDSGSFYRWRTKLLSLWASLIQQGWAIVATWIVAALVCLPVLGVLGSVFTCQFPGVCFFEWALLLTLAAPAYLLAYTDANWLEYFGPVQTRLRTALGWESATGCWFPNVRSIWGAIAMFTLTLYPYVYRLARVAFLEQSVCTIKASRSSGCGPWRSFTKVAIPLARPAIIAGSSLTIIETLNDFGTVQYFSRRPSSNDFAGRPAV